MKRLAVILSLLCLFAAGYALTVSAEPAVEPRAIVAFRGGMPVPAITGPVKVIEVYDGDTVTCEVTFHFRLRLDECWAPEVKGPQKKDGEKSRDNLKKLCDGKAGIVVIPWQEDIGRMTTLSRVIGSLYVDGKNMGEEQVKAGFAGRTKEHEAELFP